MDLFGRKEYDDKLRNQAKADLERSGNMPVIFNQETNHPGSQIASIPGVDQSSNLGNVLDWKMQPVITDWEPVDNFDGNYKNIHVSTDIITKPLLLNHDTCFNDGKKVWDFYEKSILHVSVTKKKHSLISVLSAENFV